MTVAQLPTVEGEKPEREMSYCSSPMFFCFSVLSFYSLASSSLPLSICLSNNPLLPSLYSVLFFKFVSHKFCPSSFLFPFSSPLTFILCSFSKILPPSILLFPCIYRQPGENTIPCPSAGHGSPSHFSSIMLAGYGCVGMGHAGFLGKWGGEKERRRIAGNKDLKSSSSLPLHAQGRRRTVLKRYCFGLFSFSFFCFCF